MRLKELIYVKHISQGLVSNQFSSVTQSCPTPCDPMKRSTPGLAVYHQLPESTQTHVHCVSDPIQPSHPLLSSSPPALNLSQHQGLFKWVSSSYQVAKVLEFQLQHQALQWTPRTDLLQNGLVGSLCSPKALKSLPQHHSSKASILRRSAFFIFQLSHPYMTECHPLEKEWQTTSVFLAWEPHEQYEKKWCPINPQKW